MLTGTIVPEIDPLFASGCEQAISWHQESRLDRCQIQQQLISLAPEDRSKAQFLQGTKIAQKVTNPSGSPNPCGEKIFEDSLLAPRPMTSRCPALKAPGEYVLRFAAVPASCSWTTRSCRTRYLCLVQLLHLTMGHKVLAQPLRRHGRRCPWPDRLCFRPRCSPNPLKCGAMIGPANLHGPTGSKNHPPFTMCCG